MNQTEVIIYFSLCDVGMSNEVGWVSGYLIIGSSFSDFLYYENIYFALET